MKRIHLLLALLIFSLAGLAYSQSVVGPMFRLGSTSTASRPTSGGSLTAGALMWDGDAGAVIVNDGNAWSTLGGGGGASYFVDAGAGIIKLAPDVSGFQNTDGGAFASFYLGSGFNFYDSSFTPNWHWLSTDRTVANPTGTLGMLSMGPGLRLPGVTYQGFTDGTLYVSNRSGVNSPTVVFESVPQGGNTYVAMNMRYNGGERVSYFATNTGVGICTRDTFPLYFYASDSACGTVDLTLETTGTLTSSQAAGSNAFYTSTNGARWDHGTGSDDYCVSDGTGIETPSYWESTRAFSSGPGIIAPVLRTSGAAQTSYDSTAASAQAAGSLSYNSTQGTLWVKASSGFKPVGQPHMVADKQVFSIRLGHAELAGAYPEIDEKIRRSSTTTYQMYWTDTAQSTTLFSGRSWWPIVATGGGTTYGVSANSSGTTTPTTIVGVDQLPTYCVRVYVDASFSGTPYFGLSSAVQNSATPSGNFIGFSRKSGDWSGITVSGGTVTEVILSPLAISTGFLLCASMRSSSAVDFFADGVYYGSSTTNIPTSGTKLYLFEGLVSAGGSETIYVGASQVEYN